jgi:hypothetical protein
MDHPLVNQLHFARAELQRCLAGVTNEDAGRHFRPMNCLSWIVGHLANQENSYWFHTGEAHAIRQLLGHSDLPEFIGDMSQAQYRAPEAE